MVTLGLHVTGTLGLLLRAKREGHIDSVAAVLKELEQDGFFVSDHVRKMILEQAKE